MSATGIPEPRPDLESLYATVSAIKEAIEVELQGVRGEAATVTARERQNFLPLAQEIVAIKKRLDTAGI